LFTAHAITQHGHVWRMVKLEKVHAYLTNSEQNFGMGELDLIPRNEPENPDRDSEPEGTLARRSDGNASHIV